MHKWLYMYAYSFYLFFDFAGYSLFAVSYLYGINTPPNFKQPFKAKILKISGIDGICHYHSGLEIVFICVHYSICRKNI